jgi:hypothetical protein
MPPKGQRFSRQKQGKQLILGVPMSLMKIYFSNDYDAVNHTVKLSSRMGTLDALSCANKEPLKETERVIDAKHLDGNGFWTPVAIAQDDQPVASVR